MSSEWLKTSFADLIAQGVLEIGDGYRAKNDELGGEGIIFLRAGHVRDTYIDFSEADRFKNEDEAKFRGKIAKPGDVVITTKGNSTGRVAFVTSEMPRFVYSPHLSYWRSTCETKLAQGFIRAWSRSQEFMVQLGAMSRSTDMAPYLSLTDQRRLTITLPPSDTQQAIAAFLDAVESRIDLLRETNATLEAITQALFKSWFVDFDPVHAKAEGRALQGLDAEISGLFPNTLEMSSLGETPKGWKLVTLSEAYEINPSRKLPKGTVAPYLDMAKVQTSGHTVEQAVDREAGSGSKFINGDTLLARITPCLENGKTAFVDFLKEGQVGWGSTEFVVLRPRPPLPVYHGYLLCRHDAFRQHAIQSMSGTSGRQRIQNDVLGRYPVALPTEAVCNAFNDVVSHIQQTIFLNHVQAQTLSGLRGTLLPRLISGQLRLPEMEILLQDAA